MKKITDRFWLGTMAGLAGNIAKHGVERIFNASGFSQEKATEKAAGIFLKKSDVSTPYGKAVGYIADYMIAAGLGITCSYSLTLVGKDKYLFKGAVLGAAEWSALYGVLSKLGATAIYPVKPRDALAAFLSHLAFGAVKMGIVANLGDERLFKPENLSLEIEEPQDLM
ncbi:MAG: hypothetical protein K6T80_05840 [Firmicutes bacterium]|nr:hypothetical protein [Bacillota bacterium]